MDRIDEIKKISSKYEKCDFYGHGKIIEDFERKIAKILGKKSAVFMPTGVMAQVIAIKIRTDQKKNKLIAFHPSSHLELHEENAYSKLYGLKALTFNDLDEARRLNKKPSVIIWELPTRETGGHLPNWKELVKFSKWARKNKIFLHMDGARLWECKPFYKKSYKEICGLFDSVYVSFYKGIGAIAGAVLAGDPKFINEAKIWQRRQGGNVISLFPYVLSADVNFDRRINKMEAYFKKTFEVARIFKEEGFLVTPYPPHANRFHVRIGTDIKWLEKTNLRIAAREKVLLFNYFNKSGIAEITVGDSTLKVSNKKIKTLVSQLKIRS